jgi:hypothetical protein
MKKAKAKVLAVEANKTFLLEKEKFINRAKEYGITVMSVKV